MLMSVDSHTRIADLRRFICDRLDEPLQRKMLAKVSGYSVPHLHRVFTVCTGESIAMYVRSVRLYRAGLKLRFGAVDITEVALAAGYGTHAAFSKAFKRHYGLSPSEFRQLGCVAATQLLRKVKPV